MTGWRGALLSSVSRSRSMERPQPATMAPRAARSRANCLPMPLEAPVIMMTWFLKSIWTFENEAPLGQIGLEASRASCKWG